MRKSRYTETQIVRILKEVEGGRQVNGSAGSMASLMPPTTTGRLNTEGWMPPTSESSRSLRMKTDD